MAAPKSNAKELVLVQVRVLRFNHPCWHLFRLQECILKLHSKGLGFISHLRLELPSSIGFTQGLLADRVPAFLEMVDQQPLGRLRVARPPE